MLGGVAFIVRSRLGRREVVVEEEAHDAGGAADPASTAGREATERRVVVEKRVE
jgi:hypothetical protein